MSTARLREEEAMKKSGLIALVAAMRRRARRNASVGLGRRRPTARCMYQYWGQVEATGSASVTITVQNGNHPALRSLLGQSQVQTFATDAKTVFLKWDKGKPTVVGIGDLAQHDYVLVHIRADRGASLDTIKGTPAKLVGDHGPTVNPPRAAALPLPRDARLGRGRQGHDRRQGRQPARPAAHDRPGARSRRSRPTTAPSSSTGSTGSRPSSTRAR